MNISFGMIKTGISVLGGFALSSYMKEGFKAIENVNNVKPNLTMAIGVKALQGGMFVTGYSIVNKAAGQVYALGSGIVEALKAEGDKNSAKSTEKVEED